MLYIHSTYQKLYLKKKCWLKFRQHNFVVVFESDIGIITKIQVSSYVNILIFDT